MAGDDATLLKVLAAEPADDAAWETTALALQLAHAVDAWAELDAAGEHSAAAEAAASSADAIEARTVGGALHPELAAEARRMCAALRARPPARLEILGAAGAAGAALVPMGHSDAATRIAEAVLRHARLNGAEGEIAVEAQLNLARALPFSSTLDAARRTVRVARRLARELGLARQSAAAINNLAVCDYRAGDLDRAVRRAARARRIARRAGWRDVAAHADHIVGSVHFVRGEVPRALRYTARALPQLPARWRHRCLADLGAMLMEVGHGQAAWETLALVELAARDRLARRSATLNLLRLAADLGLREEFDRRREALLGAQRLPAVMLGALYCMIGESYHCFGEPERAREAFRKAIAISAEHGTRDWAAKAEQGIAALAAPAPTLPPPPPELAPTVSFILRHVRRLREALVDA